MPPAVLAHERYRLQYGFMYDVRFLGKARGNRVSCRPDETVVRCVCVFGLEGACVCAVVGSIGLEGVCIKASLLRDTDEGSRGLLYDFTSPDSVCAVSVWMGLP